MKAGLAFADYAVIAVFFAVMLGVGVYYSRKSKSSDQFFGNDKTVPWWLSGVSFYMNSFSALAFVMYSALAYKFGWVPVMVSWLSVPAVLLGAWFLETFGVRLTMTWWSAIFATAVVIFPLMYRTARGAFESFDETLGYSAKSLGLSDTYIFWRIRMPYCKQGILAGTVLAFARALGEYGATSMIAGYTPGRTATISTTVYQLWRTNDDALAFRWVLVNLAISFVVLLAVNLLEKKTGRRK